MSRRVSFSMGNDNGRNLHAVQTHMSVHVVFVRKVRLGEHLLEHDKVPLDLARKGDTNNCQRALHKGLHMD